MLTAARFRASIAIVFALVAAPTLGHATRLGPPPQHQPPAAPPPIASAPPPAPACVPACRSGFVCNDGKCISACNPPCGANETCTSAGECVAPATPPVATASTPVPVVTPPAASSSAPAAIAPAPIPEPVLEAPTGVHTHDGWYARLAAGPGLIAFGRTVTSGGTVHTSGAGAAIDLAIGKTIRPGLVFGGGVHAVWIPSAKETLPPPDAGIVTSGAEISSGGTAHAGTTFLTAFGPFVDYYFDPARGLHVLGAADFAVLSVGAGEDSAANSENVYPATNQHGYGFALTAGIGYEWWVASQFSVGVLARVQYAFTAVSSADSSGVSDFHLVFPSIGLAGTYH